MQVVCATARAAVWLHSAVDAVDSIAWPRGPPLLPASPASAHSIHTAQSSLNAAARTVVSLSCCLDQQPPADIFSVAEPSSRSLTGTRLIFTARPGYGGR